TVAPQGSFSSAPVTSCDAAGATRRWWSCTSRCEKKWLYWADCRGWRTSSTSKWRSPGWKSSITDLWKSAGGHHEDLARRRTGAPGRDPEQMGNRHDAAAGDARAFTRAPR